MRGGRLIALLLVGSAGALRAEALSLRVDATRVYQTLAGFGASDAWRCQFVGRHWPRAKREAMADLLFSREVDAAGSPRGIGLSLWRFYLSAGTTAQGEASDIANPWRRGECFVDANGVYDWTRQAGQQWFLHAARARGVERLLAFSIAAPVFWSGNGKGYATRGDWHFNVAPDHWDDYVTYLVEVMAHFAAEGLTFDLLSPWNEPQWDWSKHTQEGTPATNAELHRFARDLSRGLAGRGLTTRLLLGEAAQLSFVHGPERRRPDCSDQIRAFFDRESPLCLAGLPNLEYAWTYHSYFAVWPPAVLAGERRRLAETVAAVDPNLAVWQTEYCILQRNDEIDRGAGRDLGMDTALYVARIIHADLTIAQARSWQWWTALTQCDFKDGLIYLDDGQGRCYDGPRGPVGRSLRYDGAFHASKLLWVLGNYARFIRPGAVRLACSLSPSQDLQHGLLASAYRGAEGRDLVIVVTNQGRQAQTLHLPGPGPWRRYTTDAARDLHYAPLDAATLRAPARSVTTLVGPIR